MKVLQISTLLIICSGSWLFAQNNVPYLERIISITLTNERLDLALKKIGEQGGFTFSYNPSIIEIEKRVTLTFRQKTVREILDELFAGSIEYKIRANHIILTRSKDSSMEDDEKILSGYIIDEATGQRLKDVSVYDPVTMTSTVTDSYGYFEMKIERPPSQMKLVVNKQNYSDTIVAVSTGIGRLLNIPIKIDKQKWATLADSVSQKLKRFWNYKILHPKKHPNLVNIRDTLYRDVQFSFLPFLGTNHLLSGNVTNDFSFNLIGGYSGGIEKAELGGIFNVVRNDVHGVQVAGIFNTVGGQVNGGQIGGIFNANYGRFSGVQFGGIANINWNSASIFSAAGLFNFTRRESSGFHLAGLSNLTIGQQQGVHTAGLFNFATDHSGSVQLAGTFNFAARSFKGFQGAGVFNFTGGNFNGSQMAGVLNFTGRKIAGSQIAGVLNYASKVEGNQLGLVNIADSVKGIPIGFFSFVLRGYHKIEFSADEIFYTNAAFRTGVHAFYNIFTAGAKPETFADDQTYWTFGYGVGTSPRLAKWLYLNLDITANQIMHQPRIEAVNLLNKVYLGVDLQTTKNLSITFGATLNGYVTDNTYDGYAPLFSHHTPHIFRERNFGSDLNLKMWWGAKVGIRFL